jgi:Drexlerviridae HNH endonuclease
MHNGRNVHIGYFSDIEEAKKARRDTDERYGYHKNHGRFD